LSALYHHDSSDAIYTQHEGFRVELSSVVPAISTPKMDDITPTQKSLLQQEDQEKYDEKADYTVSNAGQLNTLTTGEEVEVKKWV
jgi:hypothetical protein